MRFKFKAAAQKATAATVKTGHTQLGTIIAYNPDSAVTYLQLFDSTSPTVGTTAPDEVIGVPPLSTVVVPDDGVNYTNALKLAATTTATGSSAPTTGLDITIRYS